MKPLPEPGSVYLAPLEGGGFTVCRVLRRATEAEEVRLQGPAVLVAGSVWTGMTEPELNDPSLGEIPLLTHHAWQGVPLAAWVSERVPRSFRHLGTLPPHEAEAVSQDYATTSWHFFPIQAEAQQAWDRERAGTAPPAPTPADAPAPVGRMVLHRFNGAEEYPLVRAIAFGVEEGEGLRLWLEADAGEATRTLPDTAELGARPHVEVGILLAAEDLHSLPGRTLRLPQGHDEEHGALATLYYVEHQELQDNVVCILGREADVFEVRWTATTMDVNYYDGSKPDNRVEIEGRFTLR